MAWSTKYKVGARLLALVPLTALGLLTRCEKGPPLPSLLEGVQGDSPLRTGPKPLNDILQVRFPIGSPEANLIRELWQEGFQPVTALDVPEREAAFERKGGLQDLALRTAKVTWSADANGRLIFVSGYYRIRMS
jgi:hypothetical protein